MYLSDVLKVIDSDDISIDFKFNQENKVSSALIVRPVDKENTPYTHVIMPMTF
jgi:DNA polymerase III sliding clamp (beta) subunit (PCNA family)